MARRTIRTAASASAGLAGIVTVAVGSGGAAALLVPDRDAFGLVLTIAGALALLGGILGGPLLGRFTGARATRPAQATDPPVPVEHDRGDR
jgi:hypothetical protein